MITLVGNVLNSNNKKVLDKMNKMDFEFIRREVVLQIRDGAEFIELNAVSLLDNELSFLKEAISIIEGVGSKALVRSHNVHTLVEVIKFVKNEVVVGDIEFSKRKIDTILNAAKGKNVKIVAAIKDPENDPDEEISPEKSLLIAQKYIDYLLDSGFSRERILLDPVVNPLEQHCENGRRFLNTLELFKLDFPQVKTIANLSALSEGLPMRWLISSNFVSLAIEKGLDYIILDVLEKSIIESIITTLMIIGKDRNMQSYLSFCRNSRELRRKGALSA
jgi:5-methyltetrahydrofolate--homocysteine methyltransferase